MALLVKAVCRIDFRLLENLNCTIHSSHMLDAAEEFKIVMSLCSLYIILVLVAFQWCLGDIHACVKFCASFSAALYHDFSYSCNTISSM